MIKRLRKVFNRRFHRFYRYSRLYIVTDIVLIAIVIILAVLVLRLYSYQPEVNLSPWSRSKDVELSTLDLNNPPLNLSYEKESSSIDWQDGANIKLRLKNNGVRTLSNIKLSVVLESKGFSLSRIEFSNAQKTSLSGIEIKGFDIYLDELNPGTDREVALNISFTKLGKGAQTIAGRIYSEYEVGSQIIKESISLIDFKVASEISANAKAYYNSPQGDQLGRGPFPPEVGLETNLWVFFEAQPSSEITNFTMSARLAPNVDFASEMSLLAGTLTYNKDTRQIIWQVARLDEDNDAYKAGFEIILKPEVEQVGDYANILNNIKYQALDSFTGLAIHGALKDIDTSLKYDAINRDEGIVVADKLNL